MRLEERHVPGRTWTLSVVGPLEITELHNVVEIYVRVPFGKGIIDENIVSFRDEDRLSQLFRVAQLRD